MFLASFVKFEAGPARAVADLLLAFSGADDGVLTRNCSDGGLSRVSGCRYPEDLSQLERATTDIQRRGQGDQRHKRWATDPAASVSA